MQDILARIRAKKADEGFTLIELLVVVVIIGILVAIAIPVYLNYREGAADKSAQSDVRGAITAVEQFYTDNSNTYPTSVPATSTSPITLDASHKINISSGTTMAIIVGTGAYKICAFNAGGNTVATGVKRHYVYDSATGGSVAKNDSATFSMTTCA